MVRLVALILAIASAPALAQQGSLQPTPAALSIFERDWVLMNWALKFYDRDRDILLSASEANAAADAFRKIADTDSDGRVTREEYRAARAFILARY